MTDLPPPETTPLSTVRLATGTPSFAEASLSSSARAATAAARMRWPVDDIEFEPPMPPVWATTQPSLTVLIAGRSCSVDVPLIIWLIVDVELLGGDHQEAGRDAVARARPGS